MFSVSSQNSYQMDLDVPERKNMKVRRQLIIHNHMSYLEHLVLYFIMVLTADLHFMLK